MFWERKDEEQMATEMATEEDQRVAEQPQEGPEARLEAVPAAEQPAAGQPAADGPSTDVQAVAEQKMVNPVERLDLESRVQEALRLVYDPEIPVNIYELGLIYDLQVDDAGKVDVQMTLTAPSCPEAELIPGRVETAVKGVEGVTDANVELVWEPPWTPARMSEAAKLQLGILY